MSRVHANTARTAISGAGFTLLEIVVAIFIFAVVITTIFGSFRAVFSSADAVGGDVAVMASARTCLARMATDLESAFVADYPRYRQPDFDDPPDPYQIKGDSTDLEGTSFSRLQFTTLAHLVLNRDPRTGIARVIYYADQLPDDSLVLRRADDLFPFPEFEKSTDDPILCDGLVDFKLAYGDEEGETSDAWDSESADDDYATPRFIDVRLTVGSSARPILLTTRIPLHAYRKAKE